jgi:hypothetical protein
VYQDAHDQHVAVVPVMPTIRDEHDDGEGKSHRKEPDRVEPVEEDDQVLRMFKHPGLDPALS